MPKQKIFQSPWLTVNHNTDRIGAGRWGELSCLDGWFYVEKACRVRYSVSATKHAGAIEFRRQNMTRSGSVFFSGAAYEDTGGMYMPLSLARFVSQVAPMKGDFFWISVEIETKE